MARKPNKSRAGERTRVTVEFYGEIVRQIDQEAERRHTTRSEIVRSAVVEALERRGTNRRQRR